MNTRSAITFGPLTLGLSVLMLGGAAAAIGTATIAAASARDESRAERQGRGEANIARGALARGQVALAIVHAEAAVAFQPRTADYRMLLGQSYLKAGRFSSARDAFADTLTLDGSNGKAALQFALAQIATGDWAGARKTLDAHADTIPVGDRGLAIALAGDPAAAVELLGAAARTLDADAKTRQNLALSLALAGRWREAQTVAAIDVAPADVSKRILEWATFAQPKSASDQVAALLGITPVADAGQPAALALNAAAAPVGPAPVATAMAKVRPVDRFMPGKADATAPAAVPGPVTAPVGPTIAGIVFAERKEVVQTLPVAVAAKPVKAIMVAARVVAAAPVAMTVARVPAKGDFYVQLGAYDNAAVAHDAWGRMSRRFAGHAPQGMNITGKSGTFYRLSVGGFARGDAVKLCASYRAKGGDCFVRAGAGDQVAMWAKGRELASR